MRIISAKFTKHSRPFFGVPNNVPLRLFHQLEQLQKALFRCAVEGNPFVAHASSLPIRVFAVKQCRTELVLSRRASPVYPQGSPPCTRRRENASCAGGASTKTPSRESGSGSPPGSRPILSASLGDIFRELQRLSPGRYQPLQIRTLQRGMRKIRANPARKPLRSNGKL